MIGIYIIKNNINKKVYIGQSWDIDRRIKDHFKKEKSPHLKNAFEKYGYENFSSYIIESFEEISQERLNEIELKYICEYNSLDRNFGYNIRYAGNRGKHSQETKDRMRNSQLGKKHTEEIRKKLSDILSGKNHPNYGKHLSQKTKEKISNKKLGQNHTEETKKLIILNTIESMKNSEILRKISESSKSWERNDEYRKKMSDLTAGENNPFFGKNHSLESRKKMSNKKILNIRVLCVETNIIYENAFEAAKIINGHSSNIIKVCQKKRKTSSKYHWEFVD